MEIVKPKVGDRVRLKSGGPVMTIELAQHDYPELLVICTWFDARAAIRRSWFKVEALRMA